jgi:RNA polymerase sigma-70 factor (ECF subfamily)
MLERMESSPEEALVSRSARGDEQAFAVLVNRYKGMLYTMSYKLLRDPGRAEDAAQDTFIKAYAALPGFKGQSKFSSWLYRICYNTCISMIRKRKPEVDIEQAEHIGVEGPAEEFRTRELAATIRDEVNRLPDAYRSALMLYHFNGMSYDEIAQLTRKPMGTVKAHIHRGRSVLKARLLERVGWDSLKEAIWQ